MPTRTPWTMRWRTSRSGAQGRTLALVFYAGHGMEMNGANYLVPVDARLATAAAVARETIALDSVLAATFGARTRIVILDACRNNPFARTMRGAQRANVRSGGLAAVSTGAGLLVAYAAAAGDVAGDGEDSRNSPYTAALLEQLRSPGVEVRVMLGNVGGAVSASTGADQQPFVYTSLTGEHYLVGRGTQPVAVANDSSLRQQETVFWQSVRESTNPADFEAYKRRFPGGVFEELADNRLAALTATDPPRRPRPSVPAPDPVPAPTPVAEPVPAPAAAAARVSRYQQRAEQGEAFAQNRLGYMYLRGDGVSQDFQEAVRWFRRSAEQGNAAGQYSLGRMYRAGDGVPQDTAVPLSPRSMVPTLRRTGERRRLVLGRTHRIRGVMLCPSNCPKPADALRTRR